MASESSVEKDQQIELLTQKLQIAELMLSMACAGAKFGDPVDEIYFLGHYDKDMLHIYAQGRFMYWRKPDALKKADRDLLANPPEDMDMEMSERVKNLRHVRDGLELLKTLKGGERVLVTLNNLPLKVVTGDTPRATGMWGTLKRPFSKSTWLLEQERKGDTASVGSDAPFIPTVYVPPEFQDEVYVGCRVLLDEANRMVIYVQPKTEAEKMVERKATRYSVSTTSVSFEDIGGLDSVRDWFQQNLRLPFENPELFQKYGLGLPKGALLAGPPGNGKSLLAKAIATDIGKMHGKPGFFAINGPELLNCYVGETERAIRDLFAAADDFYKENKYPAIIFIDEADALLSRRGSGVSSDIDKTIVPTFLSCMDGMKAATSFVLLATNRPDVLDPAITREGRLDRKLIVPRPSRESAEAIYKIHLGKTSCKEDPAELAGKAADASFRDTLVLKDVKDTRGNEHPFLLSDVISGSMIASIVQEAGRVALRRDLDAGRKKAASGLVWEDVRQSILQHVHSNTLLDHGSAIKEWAAARRIEVSEYTAHSYV